MSIDLSLLISDPDFAEPSVIRQRIGHWEAGRFVADAKEIRVRGIAEPTGGDDLAQLPEADRTTGLMTFYTKVATEVANQDNRQSDEILWRGRLYKVIQAFDWSRHGFYKAVAALVEVIEDGSPQF